jgi:hypothetical protein
MRYTVTALPSAQDELAEIWATASDRQAVSHASNQIDRALRDDAHTIGDPRDRVRSLAVPPLEVEFEVRPDDCLVTITTYRRTSD